MGDVFHKIDFGILNGTETKRNFKYQWRNEEMETVYWMAILPASQICKMCKICMDMMFNICIWKLDGGRVPNIDVDGILIKE